MGGTWWRDYAKDAVGADGVRYARIARYDLQQNQWDFFLYPLEKSTVKGDWIGLSEIVNLGGDRFAVIERDKQVGGAIHLKALYTFRLDGVFPHYGLIKETDDLTGKVVQKQLLADVVPQVAPFEKVEGLTATPAGQLWIAVDNDLGRHEPVLSQAGLVRDRLLAITE